MTGTSPRRAALAAAALALTTLSTWDAAAGATPSPPAPTVAVTIATPPDSHPTAYPGTPAQWNVAKAGHDATLTAQLDTATESDLVATWTSAPLKVRGPGPVVAITLQRTYLQIDPSEYGDLLTVQSRFKTSTRSAWSAWATPISTWLGMGLERGSPSAQQASATYTVPYAGRRHAPQLTVQLRILLRADRVGHLQAGLRVTA